MLRTLAVILTLFMVGSSEAQPTYFENPVPGTGNYNLIPGGDFEELDLPSNWSDFLAQKGTFGVSDNGYESSGSAKAMPISSTFSNGAGFASMTNLTGLVAGETYVLSAYFNIDSQTAGELYVDLGDRTNEINVGIVTGDGYEGWVFGYESFVAASSTELIRIVHDRYWSDLTGGGLIDNVAVTPIDSFEAPLSIPEPSSFVAIACSVACLARRPSRTIVAIARVH